MKSREIILASIAPQTVNRHGVPARWGWSATTDTLDKKTGKIHRQEGQIFYTENENMFDHMNVGQVIVIEEAS